MFSLSCEVFFSKGKMKKNFSDILRQTFLWLNFIVLLIQLSHVKCQHFNFLFYLVSDKIFKTSEALRKAWKAQPSRPRSSFEDLLHRFTLNKFEQSVPGLLVLLLWK